MRKIICLLVLLSAYSSCQTKKTVTQSANINEAKYGITRIDSVNSYFIIYAEKDYRPYKIVSKKQSLHDCQKLKIGQFYGLHLKRLLHKSISTSQGMFPANDVELKNCIELDDSTEICRERYMDDIYETDNIRGLCYIKVY